MGFLTRHQPPVPTRASLLAGVGAVIAIAITAGLSQLSGYLLIMAPFGASCVLLFSAPKVPLSQPVNVVAGHILAAAIGLACRMVLPDIWWGVAIAVGLAITGMSLLRVTHPPAGANPLVIFALDPDWMFLITPVALGAGLLVAWAVLWHRITGTTYPIE